ncbi:hypothetical protein [Spirosoma areae]
MLFLDSLLDEIEIRYDYISGCLGSGLIWFYTKVCHSLPSQIVERIKQQPIVIPEQANINWQELLYRFLYQQDGLRELNQRFIPEYSIENALAIEFYNVARLCALAGKGFDQQILDDGLGRLSERLGFYTKVLFEQYWVGFDKPPYQGKIFRLREISASYRFILHQVQLTGFPSTTPDTYRKLLTEEDFSTFLARFLKSYELKEQHLVARLERENFDRQQEDIQSALSKPLLLEAERSAIGLPSSPKLTILSEKRDGIFLALKWYIVSGAGALEQLLASQVADSPVIIEGRPANALVYIFRQAFDAGYIINHKSEIARWLVHWFQIQTKEGQEKLDYNTVYAAICKRSNIPTKTSRIPYAP